MLREQQGERKIDILLPEIWLYDETSFREEKMKIMIDRIFHVERTYIEYERENIPLYKNYFIHNNIAKAVLKFYHITPMK